MDIMLSEINRAEVLRYLGCGDNAPDALVTSQLEEAEVTVRRLAKPRAMYLVTPFSRTDMIAEILGRLK